MTATKILWGQILIVFAIVLVDDLGRDAMDGVAARLPAAARSAVVRPRRAADLSAAGLLLVVVLLRRLRARASSSKAPSSPRRAASSPIAVAIGMSVWRAREAKNVETYGSARWANADEVRAAGLLGPDGVVLGRFDERLSAP